MLNQLIPPELGPILQVVADCSDTVTQERMRELGEVSKTDNLSSFELADCLVRIIQGAVFPAGLPLQIFRMLHTPATQGVVDLGVFHSAADARSAAAAHFAGTDNGNAFQEAHARLLLHLDIQGEPMFGARLPLVPELTNDSVYGP